MRLCLDEHYSPAIASQLRDAGYDVTCVKERPELESLTDVDLLATLSSERRALLTEDVVDFAPLIAQMGAVGDSHFGVIFSTHKVMPRSKRTIGRFVAALTLVLERHPGEEDFVDRVEWLHPAPR
ncbi:MAG TPA: DUF5615 family PIN-like protein [Gaiellaceae bacterium]|nr:DUF5615 family PIN-like protein [Gaiellaceae bacterium]